MTTTPISHRGEPCATCNQPIDHDWATVTNCRACQRQARQESRVRRLGIPRGYAAPGVLTKAEAARRLGLSRDYVGRLANAGRLDLAEDAVEAERLRRSGETPPTP